MRAFVLLALSALQSYAALTTTMLDDNVFAPHAPSPPAGPPQVVFSAPEGGAVPMSPLWNTPSDLSGFGAMQSGQAPGQAVTDRYQSAGLETISPGVDRTSFRIHSE